MVTLVAPVFKLSASRCKLQTCSQAELLFLETSIKADGVLILLQLHCSYRFKDIAHYPFHFSNRLFLSTRPRINPFSLSPYLTSLFSA